MERKNSLIKKVFYIFFALCFLGAGLFFINTPQKVDFVLASASDQNEDVDNQTLPAYFLKQDLIAQSNTFTNEKNSYNSLIQNNIFMSLQRNTNTNYLKFSLAGGRDDGASEIYNYCYYPNPNDKSRFYFFEINNINLDINGENQVLTDKNFISTFGQTFNNFPNHNPQNFTIYFTRGNNIGNEATKSINLIDEDTGKVKEGLYTLNIVLHQYTCVDGKNNMDEDSESFTKEESQTITISYKFYVVDESNYFKNDLPNLTTQNFDYTQTFESSNPNAYYLFSNYSYKPTESNDETNANKIPYIEYDYLRYEMHIDKLLDNVHSNVDILYDLESSSPVIEGAEIVNLKLLENNTARIYFTELGNYAISMSAIDIKDMGEVKHKFALTGMTKIAKPSNVYLYGYQINYTDYDSAATNGSYKTGEFKQFDFDNAKYLNSADITSQFLNSQSEYSQKNYSSTFVPVNIINYIDGKEAIKTDQTPISFTQNATLNKSLSRIYTTRYNSSYTLDNTNTLNGQSLYYTQFNGMTDISSEIGTYIYVLAYTFENYYDSTGINPEQKFYQIFYFEIVGEQPEISVKVVNEHGLEIKDVYSYEYYNQNIKITDLTQKNKSEYAYRKSVTIRIYAQEFGTKNFVAGFGHQAFNYADGIIISEANGYDSDAKELILDKSYFYTIRMFYTNEMTNSNILLNSQEGSFYDMSFTIDKDPIENITSRNVSKISGTSNYHILSEVNSFSTNQSIILSWDNKLSGAKTWAYTRYFPIEAAQYYGNTDTHISQTLQNTIFGQSSTIPVNYILNLSTNQRNWREYSGNTYNYKIGDDIGAGYVLYSAGLYLIDVYDEAGNHKIDLIIIDNTNPIFAIHTISSVATNYELLPSTKFIRENATLYWGEYKSIHISNFDTIDFRNNGSTVNKELLTGKQFFYDYNNNECPEIYELMYNKLWDKKYMQYLVFSTTFSDSDGVSIQASSYTGYYLTVPINKVNYYIEEKANNNTNNYLATSNGATSLSLTTEQEKTYTVLIRDMSNTKVINNSDNELTNYLNYYSARQQIYVTYDASRFFILFDDLSTKTDDEDLTPLNYNSNVEQGTLENGEQYKTSYLTPTSLEQEFYLTFIPTVKKGDIITQIQEIKLEYYKYEQSQTTTQALIDGKTISKTYYFMQLAKTPTREDSIYIYNNSEEEIQQRIPINSVSNMTEAGKYVITRTYKIDDGFNYNKNEDFYQRKYEFYLDRNNVVSPQTTVTDSETKQSHVESLVGGDIFVSMYDNGTNSDLVVTFPNSVEGNPNSQTIYNNNSGEINSVSPDTFTSILTTNKLPVKIYIPQTKYTRYAKIQEITSTNEPKDYEIVADNYDEMNYYTSKETEYQRLIRENAIYAEIYKEDFNHLIASSSQNNAIISNNGLYALNSNEQQNGFLKLYQRSGNTYGAPITEFTEEGTYFVRIQQGYFSLESNSSLRNSIAKSLIFKFTIERSNPNFNIQLSDNSTLFYNYTKSTKNDDVQTYYTNQDIVTITWAKGNDFIAEVDCPNIKFVTRNEPNGILNSSVNPNFLVPTVSNNTYVAQLSLSRLGIYQNGGWVEISMQYENHDDKYYDICTKKLVVDLSAPNTNIKNLISNSSAVEIFGLNEKNLRTKLNANLEEIRNNNDNLTSYNISQNTGDFRYYSYTVSSTFINTLKNTSDKFRIYTRSYTNENGINTKYNPNYIQQIETSPAEFLATTTKSRFTEIIESNRTFTFTPNTYYEIIEMDMAQNLTIYTVYIVDYNSLDGEQNNLFTYSTPSAEDNKVINRYNYTIDDYKNSNASGIIHNIYSRTGFELEKINYFGDAWAQIRVELRSGVSTPIYYMMTPWNTNSLFLFQNGEKISEVKISDIFAEICNQSTRYKASMTIYNRQSGTQDSFYFNFRNTTLTYDWPLQQNEEYISFANVTATDLNSMTATTFVTKFNITIQSGNINRPIFGEEGQENRVGLSTLWQGIANVINVNVTNSIIRFALLSNLEDNTRLLYEFTDNYGVKYSEIRFYHETIITNEYNSLEDLYSYYDDTTGRTIYITNNGFQYTYNSTKYNHKTIAITSINGRPTESGTSSILHEFANENYEDDNYIRTLTYTIDTESIEKETDQKGPDYQYNITYALQLTDKDTGELRKTIYFTLYNQLPSRTDSYGTSLSIGQFKLIASNGINITNEIINHEINEETGYYSTVRILYSLPDQTYALLPIKISISTDKINWKEIATNTILECPDDVQMQHYYLKIWYDETYKLNTRGNSMYVFGLIPENRTNQIGGIYEFNLSKQDSTYWVEKTENGVTTIVEKSNTIFQTEVNGRKIQYSNHYLINMSYSVGRNVVKVRTNNESNVEATEVPDGQFINGAIRSVLWHIQSKENNENMTNVDAYIVITYIPQTNNPVERFYVDDEDGAIDMDTNLITDTENATHNVVINSDSEREKVNEITLRWKRYNGLIQNTNEITILKDGIELHLPIIPIKYGDIEYNEITLNRSGRYTISFKDNSGNVQRFNTSSGQTQTFTLIFLKDVPFTMNYTNPETSQEETSDPINKAVYNGTVTLKIDNATRTIFYASDGMPVLEAYRNGYEYTDFTSDNFSYEFKSPGNYRVRFIATSIIPEKGTIRSEWYEFTIINPNEYRYSYIFNEYNNYYIEKITKNGNDITETLLQTLDLPKLTINGKQYLSKLVLSYLDEKTGAGEYMITINSNDRFYQNSVAKSSWTYKVTIKTGEAPIRISVGQGAETTDNINITFNMKNMYLEIGECVVRVVTFENNSYGAVVYSRAITSQSEGEGKFDLSNVGTYFIQVVVGPENDPVFSYKVIKKAPMNAATIIIIVGAVLLLLVVIFIIFKLRKRISVK